MKMLRFWSRRITDRPMKTSSNPRIGLVKRMWNATAMEATRVESGLLSSRRICQVEA